MGQKARALDVAQELYAQAVAQVRAFDEAGDIGHHEAAEVRELHHAEVRFERGERVAFVGKNGEGKSTLVRAIMGEKGYEGSLTIGHNIMIGYFAQNQASLLDEEITVFQTIDDAAKGDILVLLNYDAEVQPGWLLPLVQALSDSTVAMAGPRIHHPDGSLQTSGISTFHGGGSAGGQELKDDGPSRDVDGVTGACMAVRKDAYLA